MPVVVKCDEVHAISGIFNEISGIVEMQLISATSPQPAMPMAAMYRSIWVWKASRESVGTFRTCPDLPVVISENFQFSLFGHIFVWINSDQLSSDHK